MTAWSKDFAPALSKLMQMNNIAWLSLLQILFQGIWDGLDLAWRLTSVDLKLNLIGEQLLPYQSPASCFEHYQLQIKVEFTSEEQQS